MDNLLRLNDLVVIDTHLLLWGDNALSTELNNCIFSYVQNIFMKLKDSADVPMFCTVTIFCILYMTIVYYYI